MFLPIRSKSIRLSRWLILGVLSTVVIAGVAWAVVPDHEAIQFSGIGTQVVPLPTVNGVATSTSDSYPFNASDHDTTPIDLAEHGYVEREYLISGQAHVYSWPSLDTLSINGSGPYTTRIIIRRPVDPRQFSGHVRVEPLNPTAHHDLDVQWELVHNQFMRNGDAYVGITIKPDSISALKKFDPARYASLSMANPLPPVRSCASPNHGSERTESGLAWDIISQVGRLIRSDVPENPLHDLLIRSSILTGWSQGGAYTGIYMNAIARHATLPGGKPIFDGYLPGAGSYLGVPINQCAAWIQSGDARVKFNPPGDSPVVIVTTPTDFASAASFRMATDRPDDSDTATRRIRLYEIGGGCHLPAEHAEFYPNTAELGRAGFRPFDNALYPLSSFPLTAVLDGAWANLDAWVDHGITPPHATRLTVANAPAWPPTPTKDQYGNPVGGVRTPAVDVPTKTYVERGAKGDKSMANGQYIGYDIAFSGDYLQLLYPTHQDYVDKISTDVHKLVEQRWLTPEDGEQFVMQAESTSIPYPGAP
jgi:hypothetical protein